MLNTTRNTHKNNMLSKVAISFEFFHRELMESRIVHELKKL